MRSLRSDRFARSIILPAFVLVLFLVAMPAVQAQAGNQSSSATSEQQESHHQASGQPTTPGEELAQQSREAAGEDNEAHFKQSPSVRFVARLTGLSLKRAYWLSVLVNFGIVAGVIIWLSKKSLPGMFRTRTAFIQKAMEEARKASEDANRRLAGIEARLARLGGEIEEMRAAAEKEAAAEEERIKAATAEDARRIVESAEQEIAAAAKSARRELTAYAADLAVSLAKKQIHVDAATDQVLVRSLADQLSATHPDAAGPKARKGGQ